MPPHICFGLPLHPCQLQAWLMCPSWHYERHVTYPFDLYEAQLARRRRLAGVSTASAELGEGSRQAPAPAPALAPGPAPAPMEAPSASSPEAAKAALALALPLLLAAMLLL